MPVRGQRRISVRGARRVGGSGRGMTGIGDYFVIVPVIRGGGVCTSLSWQAQQTERLLTAFRFLSFCAETLNYYKTICGVVKINPFCLLTN